jgi:hypothetical protein
MEAPALIASGNDVTLGTSKAGDEEVMFQRSKVAKPALFRVNVSSTKLSRQFCS